MAVVSCFETNRLAQERRLRAAYGSNADVDHAILQRAELPIAHWRLDGSVVGRGRRYRDGIQPRSVFDRSFCSRRLDHLRRLHQVPTALIEVVIVMARISLLEELSTHLVIERFRRYVQLDPWADSSRNAAWHRVRDFARGAAWSERDQTHAGRHDKVQQPEPASRRSDASSSACRRATAPTAISAIGTTTMTDIGRSCRAGVSWAGAGISQRTSGPASCHRAKSRGRAG